MAKKKQLYSLNEKKAILWNVVNSILAGGLVLVGALSSGSLTKQSIFLGIIVSIGVMLTNFKEYWTNTEPFAKKGKIHFI